MDTNTNMSFSRMRVKLLRATTKVRQALTALKAKNKAKCSTAVLSDDLWHLTLASPQLKIRDLAAASTVCRALRALAADDVVWQAAYARRWLGNSAHATGQSSDATGWRQRYQVAHHIDSTLWACGLRAQPTLGDDGPHSFNDTPPGAATLPETDEAAAPQQVVCGGLRFSQAVPGLRHFLAVATPASLPEAALCPEGTLYSWGSPRDARGTINRASLGWPTSGPQVGIPSICPWWKASNVTAPGGIDQLAIGGEQQCALVRLGEVYLFGRSCKTHELELRVPTIMTLPPGVKVASVSLGYDHSLLVDQAGRLHAAGGNSRGELGLGDFGDRTNNFVLVEDVVPAGMRVIAAAAGMSHSLTMSSAGTVYASGCNKAGQLGLDILEAEVSHFTEVVALPRVTAVSAGFNLSAVIASDGGVFTFGQGNEGGLGHGAEFMSPITWSTWSPPRRVAALASERVVSVAVGGGHMVALTASGAVYTWGNNDSGQCGRAMTKLDFRHSAIGRGKDRLGLKGHSKYTPGRVPLPGVARSVSAGDETTFMILGPPPNEQSAAHVTSMLGGGQSPW